MKKIKWLKSTFFTGRNGFFKCNGILIGNSGDDNNIVIAPLTSKGVLGRCDIEIPKKEIKNLISALETFIQ